MADRGFLDVSALEGCLWDAACQVWGPLDAPKFKDYILPLVFLLGYDSSGFATVDFRE